MNSVPPNTNAAKTMKIDVFFDVYPHPAKPYLESQLLEWRRQGHQLRLFSFGCIPGIPSEFPITFIRTLRQQPIRLTGITLWRCLTSPARCWRVLRSQNRLLQRIKALVIDVQLPLLPPDVHFVHNLATAVSVSYLKCACPTTKLAVYYHGGEIPGVRQISFEESSRALQRADVVFSNTHASVDEALSRGARSGQTACIPVGFPLERFRQPENRDYLPDSRWRFLCLGRMAREKGFDVTLRAIANLRKQRKNFTFHFIGEGPELRSLMTLTEQLSLGDCVNFLGYIKSYQDVIIRLAGCDVLVFSSLPVPGSNFRDTQATVMQEAMLMGAIVVASDIGGVRESLPPALHPYLYAPGSVEELTDRLTSVMKQSEDQLRSGGRMARRFVEENYDIRTINEKILATIASANSPPAARRRTISSL